MDVKLIDWKKVVEAYDVAEAQKRLKRSSGAYKSKKVDQDGEPIWDPKWVEYAINQIRGTYISEALLGVCCCSYQMSDEHISNVVLRMYARKIAPFPRPFGMDTRVPTVVWEALVQRAHEMRVIVTEWNVSGKREYWNRWYE